MSLAAFSGKLVGLAVRLSRRVLGKLWWTAPLCIYVIFQIVSSVSQMYQKWEESSRVEGIFAQAEEALDAGQYRKTIQLTQHVDRADPDRAQALLRQAKQTLIAKEGPPLLRRAQEALKNATFNEAIKLTDELNSIGAFPKKSEAIRVEAKRRGRIKNAPNLLHQAQKELADKRYDSALAQAQLIPKKAAEYSQAQRVIRVVERYKRREAQERERQRLREAKERNRRIRLQQIQARKSFARIYENEMLEKYIDMKVRTRGPNHDILYLEWILIGRPYVHNFINNAEMMAGLKIAGFKKIIFTDGSEFDRQTWTYDIFR